MATNNEVQEYLLNKALDNGGELTESQLKLLELCNDSENEAMKLESEEKDKQKNRIFEGVKWAVGGLGLGLLSLCTFYYEENDVVSGTRGRVLSGIFDRAIRRKK